VNAAATPARLRVAAPNGWLALAVLSMSEIAYLARALKVSTLGNAMERLAECDRADNWTHEEFLAAFLHARSLLANLTGRLGANTLGQGTVEPLAELFDRLRTNAPAILSASRLR
jgi:hypothetical protein